MGARLWPAAESLDARPSRWPFCSTRELIRQAMRRGAVRRALLVMAVGTGLQVMGAMMNEDVSAVGVG